MSRFIEFDPATGDIHRQLDVPADELSLYETPGRAFLAWDPPLPTEGISKVVTIDGQLQVVTTAPELTLEMVRDLRNRRLTAVINRLDADAKRQELGLATAMTPASRAEWLAYYQALCDVPQNFVPGSPLTWPTPPAE